MQTNENFFPFLFVVSFIFLAACGCSEKGWDARLHMVKAEEAVAKAYGLRTQKGVAYGQRLKYYRIACEQFSKAYRSDKNSFTLNRIQSASESCLRIENYEQEKLFRDFEEEYVKAHPDEVKYGDAGAYMSMEQ